MEVGAVSLPRCNLVLFLYKVFGEVELYGPFLYA